MEGFFEAEKGSLVHSESPNDPPDGFYFVQACLLKDENQRLKKDMRRFGSCAETFEISLRNIQAKFDKAEKTLQLDLA